VVQQGSVEATTDLKLGTSMCRVLAPYVRKRFSQRLATAANSWTRARGGPEGEKVPLAVTEALQVVSAPLMV